MMVRAHAPGAFETNRLVAESCTLRAAGYDPDVLCHGVT
jgi:hypothetical protein